MAFEGLRTKVWGKVLFGSRYARLAGLVLVLVAVAFGSFTLTHAAVSKGGTGSEPVALGDFLNGAPEVAIPLTHTGSYEWQSTPLATASPFDAYNVSWRVTGDAQVTSVQGIPSSDASGTYVMKVTFDVTSFSPGATFVLLDSHLQQAGQ
jgi:hypothetical protein